jgi:cytochrome c
VRRLRAEISLEGAIMNYARKLIVSAALVIVSVVPGLTQQRGTLEQAKVLCDRAVLHMEQVGPENAIKDFNDPIGGFVDHDLFVIVYDPKSIIRSGVPALVGKDARSLTDVTGKEFGKEIIAAAHKHDGSWVEYYMTNPNTKKVELKTSYIRLVGAYVVFVGAYKS